MGNRRNDIYDAVINRMVREALEARENEFAEKHGSDSDEALLDYLRRCALRLHHTPWPKEIVGGELIRARFGSWENALREAKLPPPQMANRISKFALYQQEVENQKEEYRRKKTEKKLRAAERRKAQEAKARKE